MWSCLERQLNGSKKILYSERDGSFTHPFYGTSCVSSPISHNRWNGLPRRKSRTCYMVGHLWLREHRYL